MIHGYLFRECLAFRQAKGKLDSNKQGKSANIAGIIVKPFAFFCIPSIGMRKRQE